jgi:hypothetical protein
VIYIYSASMGKKVRANRLNVAIDRMAEVADGLEILLASPSLWENRERQGNLHGSHFRGEFVRRWRDEEQRLSRNIFHVSRPGVAPTSADLIPAPGPQKRLRIAHCWLSSGHLHSDHGKQVDIRAGNSYFWIA